MPTINAIANGDFSATKEGISRMSQCGECEHPWQVYQTATVQSVQLYEEIRSMTEGQGLKKLSETTTKAEAE